MRVTKIDSMINMTNHKLNDDQMNIVNKHLDLGFPNIEPNPDLNLVTLAEEWLEKIESIGFVNKPVIHLQGESGFTFVMVSILQTHGYDVVHSTTERISTEVDGKKVSVFKFNGFRLYPNLSDYFNFSS